MDTDSDRPLEVQLKAARAEIKHLQSVNDMLSQNAKNHLAEARLNQDSLNEDQSSLEQQQRKLITDLRKQVEALQEKASSFSVDNQVLREKCMMLQQTIDDIHGRLEQDQKHLHSLTEHRESLYHKLNKQVSENAELTKSKQSYFELLKYVSVSRFVERSRARRQLLNIAELQNNLAKSLRQQTFVDPIPSQRIDARSSTPPPSIDMRTLSHVRNLKVQSILEVIADSLEFSSNLTLQLIAQKKYWKETSDAFFNRSIQLKRACLAAGTKLTRRDHLIEKLTHGLIESGKDGKTLARQLLSDYHLKVQRDNAKYQEAEEQAENDFQKKLARSKQEPRQFSLYDGSNKHGDKRSSSTRGSKKPKKVAQTSEQERDARRDTKTHRDVRFVEIQPDTQSRNRKAKGKHQDGASTRSSARSSLSRTSQRSRRHSNSSVASASTVGSRYPKGSDDYLSSLLDSTLDNSKHYMTDKKSKNASPNSQYSRSRASSIESKTYPQDTSPTKHRFLHKGDGLRLRQKRTGSEKDPTIFHRTKAESDDDVNSIFSTAHLGRGNTADGQDDNRLLSDDEYVSIKAEEPLLSTILAQEKADNQKLRQQVAALTRDLEEMENIARLSRRTKTLTRHTYASLQHADERSNLEIPAANAQSYTMSGEIVSSSSSLALSKSVHHREPFQFDMDQVIQEAVDRQPVPTETVPGSSGIVDLNTRELVTMAYGVKTGRRKKTRQKAAQQSKLINPNDYLQYRQYSYEHPSNQSPASLVNNNNDENDIAGAQQPPSSLVDPMPLSSSMDSAQMDSTDVAHLDHDQEYLNDGMIGHNANIRRKQRLGQPIDAEYTKCLYASRPNNSLRGLEGLIQQAQRNPHFSETRGHKTSHRNLSLGRRKKTKKNSRRPNPPNLLVKLKQRGLTLGSYTAR